MACTNIEKLLPTIRSRLTKHYVPKIDLEVLAQDLKNQETNIDRFVHCDITVADAVKYSTSNDDEVLKTVKHIIVNLKSSADIPNLVSKIKTKSENRKEFFKLLTNAFNCALTNQRGIFDEQTIQFIQTNYKTQVLIKVLKLIDNAVRKLDANVNFNYVLDDLFYNILKEKYLCK